MATILLQSAVLPADLCSFCDFGHKAAAIYPGKAGARICAGCIEQHREQLNAERLPDFSALALKRMHTAHALCLFACACWYMGLLALIPLHRIEDA